MSDKIKAIELNKPHGFLVWKGKQTILIDKNELSVNEPVAIVSDNDFYGLAKLEEAIEVNEDFIKDNQTSHRLKDYELPDGTLYAYKISSFEGLKEPIAAKIENGFLVVEDLPEQDEEILKQAKELPSTITIKPDAISIDKNGNVKGQLNDSLLEILNKNFGITFKTFNKFDKEYLGLYDLTLTRKPNMRFKIMQPPNLRMADSESLSCKLCHHWNNGTCELYSYPTDANQICDTFTPKYSGTFISLPIPLEVANFLSLAEKDVPMGSELVRPEDMHITLYYEKDIDPVNLLELPQLLDYIASEIPAPAVNINGIAKFEMVENGKQDCLVVGVTSPEITKIHNWIMSYMGEEKRFTPHITLAYVPIGSQIPNINYNRETFSIPNIALNAGGTRMFETSFRGMHYPEEMEAKQMPYEKIEMNGQYCVRKIGEEEPMKCYNEEELADEYLAALRLNVEAEEGKDSHTLPKKSKEGRRLKTEWLKKLEDFGQFIQNMLTWARQEEDKMIAFAIKEVNGEPYFYTFSSNAFEDRDTEIIETAALEEYVLRNSENKIKGYFNLWHIPGTDFAEKTWQGVIGRILVEAGPFLKNKNGRKALQFFKKYQKSHPVFAPEGWGASIEFKYLPEQRPAGIYKWLWITRTSVLPLAKAANINTKGELKMLTDEQREMGKQVFGEDTFSQIEEYAEGLTKQLEKTTRYKEVDEEVVVEEEKTPETDTEVAEQAEVKVEETEGSAEDEAPAVTDTLVEQVAERVVEGLKSDTQKIEAMVSTFLKQLSEVSNRLENLESKAKVDTALKPRSWGLFNESLVNTITQSDKGKIATEDEIEKVKPVETKANEKGDGYGGAFFTR